ncbi:hypothetical protein SNOG_08969 [Parastagonospora nodorum SN15]|uniref:Uncharacterized protein n=1 Tax=Phaeosphaeria nodorum (strain SN15 / ATCC MYA-4574 / FGSC 10173) TaxID=321614 RepID=Q0UGZ5_PHANO|nr:hypothetical protein SNOG_08969 [Parastagonospora nodorum SN15]EAT84137.1 hypothetical protein SNOG_08969 [Parastagonospora nodorum SN15]
MAEPDTVQAGRQHHSLALAPKARSSDRGSLDASRTNPTP